MDYGQASENGQTDYGQTDDNSNNIDIRFKSPVAVRDVQAVALARRQNAAANGRLFCLMLFCVCLLLWLFSPDNFFMWLAMFSTLPVAGAVAADNVATSHVVNLVTGQVQSQPGNHAARPPGHLAAGQSGNLPANREASQVGVQAGNPAGRSSANPTRNSSGQWAHYALHAALCGINTGVPVAVFILILLNIG